MIAPLVAVSHMGNETSTTFLGRGGRNEWHISVPTRPLMSRRQRNPVNVSSRRRLLSILGVTLLVVPPVATAQTGPRSNPRVLEAHDLYLDHQVMESLQLLEDVIDEQPETYDALWAAARSAVALGLLSRGQEIQNQWYKTGESYARRATEVEPDDIEGLYWLLTAKGLRAAQSGGREASALGGEVHDLAHQVLEMDSLHAGAYHALGVLNYRVQRLSWIERFVARNFMGADVMNGTSWEQAEQYLTRAAELRPEYILFHLDLGRMYLHRDQKDEARRHLERVLELPVLEPPDTRFQMIAERRLEETLD